jgi:hypothetical protein
MTYSQNSLVKTQAKAVFEWGPVRALAKCYGFDKTVTLAIKEYNSFFAALDGSTGFANAVKICKDLNSNAKLAAIGVTVDSRDLGGKWFSTDQQGIPKSLKHLRALLAGGVYSKRIAVSITSQVETLKIKPSNDITTITMPFKGCREEVTYWSKWCMDYSNTVWTKHVTSPVESRYHTSTSGGPNGGASVLSAGVDTLAINGNPLLDSLFKEVSSSWGRNDLLEDYLKCSEYYLAAFKSNLLKGTKRHKEEGYVPARILHLPDKAGKTRTVYCLTWWFQELLQPFHKELYKLLYTIKQDGTKSHSDAAQVVKTWTCQGLRLWSFDLTAATDRLPMDLQHAVVAGLKGKEFADLWRKVMSIPAYHSATKGYVRYSVGQPMGAKTSWAVFALTHHTILRILCRFHRVHGQAYVIIGDDIVIANEAVANSYKGLLKDFGVDYSPKKTITPDKGNGGSVAEFAKRIFRNGVEYSPLTANMLKAVYKDHNYATFLSVLNELNVKWGFGVDVYKDQLYFLPPAFALFQLLPKSWKGTIAVTIGSAADEGALFRGNLQVCRSGLIDNPWKEIDNLTFLNSLGAKVTERLSQLLQDLMLVKEKLGQGQPEEAWAVGTFLQVPGHPIQGVLKRLDEVIHNASAGLANGDLNLQMLTDIGIDIGYLKEVALRGTTWSSWKRLMQRRASSNLNFWKSVYQDTQQQDECWYYSRAKQSS